MQTLHRTGRAARAVTRTALAGILALGASAVYAASTSQGPVPAPAQQTSGDVNYRVGGVGSDEAKTMRQLASDYPLALTFVERAGDGRDMFTADVDVRIADSSGATQLETQAEGPLMLVELPDGTYTVTASLAGESKSQKVSIRDGQPSRVVFVWPERHSEAQQVSLATQ